MGNFKNKIYGFFYGRYGYDKLNYFLIGVMLVLSIADMITGWLLPETIFKIFLGLGFSLAITGLFIWSLFRMMSRNRYKRMRENSRFLNILGALRRFFTLNTSNGTKSRNRDDEFFVFRDCTKCRATLRLPRKKGRNRVKCPRCSHSFYVK